MVFKSEMVIVRTPRAIVKPKKLLPSKVVRLPLSKSSQETKKEPSNLSGSGQLTPYQRLAGSYWKPFIER